MLLLNVFGHFVAISHEIFLRGVKFLDEPFELRFPAVDLALIKQTLPLKNLSVKFVFADLV